MSLLLNAATTALVLIDLQEGILDQPLAPYSADDVVARCCQLATTLKSHGGCVVRVRVGFSAGGVDRLKQPVDLPMIRPTSVPPERFATLVPAAAALEADVDVLKHQWGAWHGTALDLQLRRRGIDTIIMAGVATNFGVESTARQGWELNYRMVIAEDACSTVSADMHHFAMTQLLPRLGVVRDTDTICAALAG